MRSLLRPSGPRSAVSFALALVCTLLAGCRSVGSPSDAGREATSPLDVISNPQAPDCGDIVCPTPQCGCLTDAAVFTECRSPHTPSKSSCALEDQCSYYYGMAPYSCLSGCAAGTGGCGDPSDGGASCAGSYVSVPEGGLGPLGASPFAVAELVDAGPAAVVLASSASAACAYMRGEAWTGTVIRLTYGGLQVEIASAMDGGVAYGDAAGGDADTVTWLGSPDACTVSSPSQEGLCGVGAYGTYGITAGGATYSGVFRAPLCNPCSAVGP